MRTKSNLSQQTNALGSGDLGRLKEDSGLSTDRVVQMDREFPQAALSDLAPHMREKALDEFAFRLSMYFDRNNREIKSREAVMKEVGKSVGHSFDTRQFDVFLEALFNDGYLRMNLRTLVKVADRVKDRFNVRDVTVVSGDSDARFAHVAAGVLIREIARIGEHAKSRKMTDRPAEICIGIVSGTTNQKVIECATKLDWDKDCGVDPMNLPNMKFLAINTCPVHPENIDSNAMILASRMAAKINESCGRGQRRAKAYGLNVPVIVEKEKLSEVDQALQNSEVIKHTEPHRVQSSDGKGVPDTQTSLDIILTSVGELGEDDETGSMFYKLARRAIPNMNEFVAQTRLVGDLAYNPLSSTGEEVVLRDNAGKQILFYSAASLPIFASVAADQYKSVILVAQSKQGKKIPVIYASLGDGRTTAGKSRRYVSHLVIDEQTSDDLLHY